MPTPHSRRRSVRLVCAHVALAALALLGIPAASRAAPMAHEYDVKAVYLLGFAKFIRWPASAFANAKAPFVIGVLGKDPFKGRLARACANGAVGGRPVVIRHLKRGAPLKGCHIVFVCDSEKRHMARTIAGIGGAPVLMIGDFAGFAAKGGHFNFIPLGGGVSYEFNPGAAGRNGFTIPAKIQSPGTRVP